MAYTLVMMLPDAIAKSKSCTELCVPLMPLQGHGQRGERGHKRSTMVAEAMIVTWE